MWEGLAAATGVELGKLVLDQVLNLGKTALEDYVKDFFKDSIKGGVTQANATVLKRPMAEAIGYFIKRFVKELQINDVPDTSIDHHYLAGLKKFVKDRAVFPILGKAFEKECKQIDYEQLQQIWTQCYQNREWRFPAEFDWRGVAKEYAFEVKGIIKRDLELRSLLETELLEDIARNTAHLNRQISPGFDIAKYRNSLQTSYGYLKLYTLDSTDDPNRAIKLWNMFIEQTVREALPPTRYEVPLDLKRQLQAEGRLETDLSAEALEHYRREYFQQPSQKVLEALDRGRSSLAFLQKEGTGDQSLPFEGGFRGIEAHSQRAVILGDPGAGKSTLLQYLALEWVESQTLEVSKTSKVSRLPLLIELREYAIAQPQNFLDFLQRGRGADWQFDQQQLHQYLLDSPSLVMFDGLDEVFDRPTQASTIDEIIRFAQQYPQAQIIVTSRIIGYNPDRFQHAGFRQFTLQPLDTDEIHEFIDRWYDLAMGTDPDRERLKQRLQDAIAHSRAIQNLADNPLLLTMMAILNRRQELPRDRADLYDQASRVLLYHWDVDHKRLNLPMEGIGRREKQEMLRAIAYEMQAGEEGLKGNLISADRLTRIITDYLRDQGFSEPREKANALIQQLRERNFILCYRGADTYSFVHRTFLEYFCAMEIVNRFEKQRTLTFEQLRDEVFGNHWQDETWHEILRLICGAIDPRFAGQLVEYLIEIEIDRLRFAHDGSHHDAGEIFLNSEVFMNLLLAADCLSEIKNLEIEKSIGLKLKQSLCSHVESSETPLSYDCTETLLSYISHYFQTEDTLEWLKKLPVQENSRWALPRQAAVFVIGKNFHSHPTTLTWLKSQTQEDMNSGDSNGPVRWSATTQVAEHYHNHPETLTWLKERANQDVDGGFTRQAAILSLAKYYQADPEILILLENLLRNDTDKHVRGVAAKVICEHFSQVPENFELLYEIVLQESFLPKFVWKQNPRQTALEALLRNYPTHSKTIELLCDRAANDPDEQLREWAEEQLQMVAIRERDARTDCETGTI